MTPGWRRRGGTALLGAAAAALLLTTPGAAAAEAPLPLAARPTPAAPPEVTIEAMDTWFEGERNGSAVLVGAGLLSLGGGVLLASEDDDFAKGLGITYGIFGGLELAFAAAYNAGLPGRRADLEGQLRRDPAGTRLAERERMQGVADRFFIYRIAEAVIAGTGVALMIGGTVADEDGATGVGLGLATQGGFILLFDQFVERRAYAYLDHLNAVTPPRPVVAVTRDGAAFGLSGSF